MKQYLELLEKVISKGQSRSDRTGTGTYSLFGEQATYDLTKGFPLLTTKKVFLKGIIHELLWFLKGETNIQYLKDNGVNIWNDWADEEGNLGPVYGYSWISWGNPFDFKGTKYRNLYMTVDSNGTNSLKPVNQIKNVVESIKNNPYSRRHIVSAWNPMFTEVCALPPCHVLFQFYVNKDQSLDCQLYQRSADIFLGVPFNIASYSLLVHMIAQVTGLTAGRFIHTFGDVHLYKNHIEQANTQLSREPRPLPKIKLNPKIKDIFNFSIDDFELCDYNPHSKIKAPVAV